MLLVANRKMNNYTDIFNIGGYLPDGAYEQASWLRMNQLSVVEPVLDAVRWSHNFLQNNIKGA